MRLAQGTNPGGADGVAPSAALRGRSASAHQAEGLQIKGAGRDGHDDGQAEQDQCFAHTCLGGLFATLGRVREIQHGLSVLSD